MNKKIMIVLFSLSLFQAPLAQAGFFDSFKVQLAAIGLMFSNMFRTTTPPRTTTVEPTVDVASNTAALGNWAPSPVVGEDPNNYQASAQVDTQPARAECVPRSLAHRCSYLENDQVVANTCVNPVPVRTGSTGGSSGVRSNN